MPTLLVTRPIEASERFVNAIRAELPDVQTVISPVIRFEAVACDASNTGQSLILTSAQASKRAAALGFQGATTYCVGAQTTKIAQEAGLHATCFGADVADLVDQLASDPPNEPLLYLRGRHVASELVAELSKGGMNIAEAIVYDQIAQRLTAEAQAALSGKEPVVLPLFSPRSARLIKGAVSAPVSIIAMSQNVADAAGHLDATDVCVAPEPTAKAMVAATCRALKAISGC